MGAVKLESRAVRKNPRQTIEKLFADAFGPWPALFRRTSWCGWRPIFQPNETQPSKQEKLLDGDDRTIHASSPNDVAIRETPAKLTVEIALPKNLKGHFAVELSDNILIITGEKPLADIGKKSKGDTTARKIVFQRMIHLPNGMHLGIFSVRLIGHLVKIEFTRNELEE